MKRYELQAHAIKVKLDHVRQQDEELGLESNETIACLSDAVTTLNALALIGEKRILILEDLIKLAQEFVADTPVDRVEVIQYQQDFGKLLNKIK